MPLNLLRKTLPLLLALCFPVLATVGAARAADGDAENKPDKNVVKRVVTVHSDDGNVEVNESTDSDDADAPEILGLGPYGDLNVLDLRESRGFLGVRLVDLTPELRQHFGAPEDAGVMIGKVEADSPAAKAGLKVGDIVTQVDGAKIDSSWRVQLQVRKKDEGDKAEIQYMRDGRTQTTTATIAKREKTQVDLGKAFTLRMKPGPGGPGREYMMQLNSEALADAAKKLQEHLSSPEMQERLRHGADLEKRMQELEKKLQEMEKRLKERSALMNPSERS